MNTAKMTKPHPIPVLLLFAAATAVLVWLLLSGVEDEPPRRAARWAETISDLDACCRRKHVRSEQYDHFAAIAAGERREAAARLFRAMALSARVQEAECAAAIGRLGGRYTPPVKVASGIIAKLCQFKAGITTCMEAAFLKVLLDRID